jgi:hypothetical protein
MIEIDNFARVQFDTCEKKYYWRIVRGLVLKEPKSLAPFFGIAIHAALEEWYRNRKDDEAIKAFASEYVKWFDPKHDEERTPENGLVILKEYFNRYREDYLEVDKELIEVGASAEVWPGEVIYQGRIDLISKWNGETVIVDHKTSAYPTSGFMVLKPNNQFTGYVWLAREITGLDIKTVVVNMIGTKIKKRLKEGEEAVVLMRDMTTREEKDFKEFQKGLLITVKRIKRCEEFNEWPMRTHSCPSFQGCEYLDLCRGSDEAIPHLIKTFYQERKWNAFEEE